MSIAMVCPDEGERLDVTAPLTVVNTFPDDPSLDHLQIFTVCGSQYLFWASQAEVVAAVLEGCHYHERCVDPLTHQLKGAQMLRMPPAFEQLLGRELNRKARRFFALKDKSLVQMRREWAEARRVSMLHDDSILAKIEALLESN